MLQLNQCCAYRNSYTVLNYEMSSPMGLKRVEFLMPQCRELLTNLGVLLGVCPEGKITPSQAVILFDGWELV